MSNTSWRRVLSEYGENYDVSSDGAIVRARGRVRGAKIGRMLKQSKNNSGYLIVDLYRENKSKKFLVHRIVAEAFYGPINESMDVNHINGNKLDNRIENLEIVSHSANMKHAAALGLMRAPKRENHRNTKLTGMDIVHIRKLIQEKKLQIKQIAELFNVTPSTVSGIKAGRTWSDSRVANKDNPRYKVIRA